MDIAHVSSLVQQIQSAELDVYPFDDLVMGSFKKEKQVRADKTNWLRCAVLLRNLARVMLPGLSLIEFLGPSISWKRST